MNTQDTLQELQKLKLHGMAKRYEAVLGQSAHEQPEPHMLVALLTEAESVYRIHQRTQLYLRLSKLRYNATPEQVNCTAGRGLTKEKLITFCDCMFIEKSENLLITGATAVEKVFSLVRWEDRPVCLATGHFIIL
jgi:hypothetical protein